MSHPPISLPHCPTLGALSVPTVPSRAGVEAEEFIRSGAPADIMLLDIRMPLRSGLEVVHNCAAQLPTYPIVAMTGHVDVEAREQFKCETAAGLLSDGGALCCVIASRPAVEVRLSLRSGSTSPLVPLWQLSAHVVD